MIHKVSIIIPWYKYSEDYHDCIQSLMARTNSRDFEVITIHSDGSFAENCNRGISIAKGEYILLLNDDIKIIYPDWLDKLIEVMKSDNKIGAVSPKMLFPDRKVQFGGMIFHDTFEGGHLHFKKDENNPILLIEPTEFQATTFGCVLLRNEALRSIHNPNHKDDLYLDVWLDESFKIGGFEDIDACFRMKLNGWKIMYQPKSVLIHKESATFRVMNQADRINAFDNNRKIYHEKWDTYFKDGTFKIDDKNYAGGIDDNQKNN